LEEIANDWEASWARWELFGVRFAEKPSEEEQEQDGNAQQEEVGFHISLCSVQRNVGPRKSRKGKEFFLTNKQESEEKLTTKLGG
jgi:hypothetical protein